MLKQSTHEAQFYTKLNEESVKCHLCPAECIIQKGKHGLCLSRINNNGILQAATYMQAAAIAMDPIEKKPLYHFYPSQSILSLGQQGCNLGCKFCQNHELSQHYSPHEEITAEQIINFMLAKDSMGVAYTYSEPLIWYESIEEIGPKVKEAGGKNVMVTNGYMSQAPLNKLLNYMDAFNVDIKSMNEDFYKKLCLAHLEPVLKSCETIKKKAHLEITNLLITGENDSDDDIEMLSKYIADNLGKDTPLHLSRYYPNYKFSAPATDVNTILHAKELASQFLDYVYTGNIVDTEGSQTLCPSCHSLLISRLGYTTEITSGIVKKEGKSLCGNCGNEIAIVM